MATRSPFSPFGFSPSLGGGGGGFRRFDFPPGSEIPGTSGGTGFPGLGGRIGDFIKDKIPGKIDDAIIDALTGEARRRGMPGFGSGLQPRGCPPGFEKRNGRCIETGIRGAIERTLPGGQTGTLADEMGQPVNGRYGVGTVPSERVTSVLDCPEGMVLGKDNICYERLRKSERKWPPGRKPLLTGGEMNAITTAARAARRLKRTQKKLKKVGRTIKKVT